MPIFWLALVLIWLFGLQLGWLPLSGRLGIDFYYEPITGFLLAKLFGFESEVAAGVILIGSCSG